MPSSSSSSACLLATRPASRLFGLAYGWFVRLACGDLAAGLVSPLIALLAHTSSALASPELSWLTDSSVARASRTRRELASAKHAEAHARSQVEGGYAQLRELHGACEDARKAVLHERAARERVEALAANAAREVERVRAEAAEAKRDALSVGRDAAAEAARAAAESVRAHVSKAEEEANAAVEEAGRERARAEAAEAAEAAAKAAVATAEAAAKAAVATAEEAAKVAVATAEEAAKVAVATAEEAVDEANEEVRGLRIQVDGLSEELRTAETAAKEAQLAAEAAHTAAQRHATEWAERDERLRRELHSHTEMHAHAQKEAEHSVETAIQQSERRTTMMADEARAAEGAMMAQVANAQRERERVEAELRVVTLRLDERTVEAEAASAEVGETARRANRERLAAQREAHAVSEAHAEELASVRAAAHEEASGAVGHAKAMHAERDRLESELRAALRDTRTWARRWRADAGKGGGVEATGGVDVVDGDVDDAADGDADAMGTAQLRAEVHKALATAAHQIDARIEREQTAREAEAREFQGRLIEAAAERESMASHVREVRVWRNGRAVAQADLPTLIEQVSRADAWPSE